jgi:RNA polymerase sigma factor (TIGR02999 family)
LRLFGEQGLEVNDRQHFYALFVRAMRNVLVDEARRRRAEKRGGSATRIPLEDLEEPCAPEQGWNTLCLDESLSRLASIDPELVRLAELRAFGGLTTVEIAQVLGISERTIERRWQKARAWLLSEQERAEAEPKGGAGGQEEEVSS